MVPWDEGVAPRGALILVYAPNKRAPLLRGPTRGPTPGPTRPLSPSDGQTVWVRALDKKDGAERANGIRHTSCKTLINFSKSNLFYSKHYERGLDFILDVMKGLGFYRA